MYETRILLAEDQQIMRDTQCRLLNAMGYRQVTAAHNGQEAWDALCTLHYDLVLCDWNMPKVNGLELLLRMRENPDTLHIPFIMVTGENAVDQVRMALASGISDFIVKPFSAALLQQRIERALQHRKTPRAA